MDYRTAYKGDSSPHHNFEKGVLTSKGAKIPLYRYIQKREDHREIVFLLHGLGSHKESWLAPRNEFERKSTRLKNRLLNEGYSLLIPDAPFHGERTYELGFRTAAMLPPEISSSQVNAAEMVKMYKASIQEIRLLIDLVRNEREDPLVQVHLVGYSLGGAVSILVNAVDDRLKSITACVPPIQRPLSEVEEFNWPEELVESLAEVTPFSYAEEQKAPTALLIGEEDEFSSVEAMENFYQRLPMSDKRMEQYQSGHELPERYIEAVVTWLKDQTA